jgi:hypothetical protein
MSNPWTRSEKLALLAAGLTVLTGLLVPEFRRMLGLEAPPRQVPQTAPLVHLQSATEDRSSPTLVTDPGSIPARTNALVSPPRTSASGDSVDPKPPRPQGAAIAGRGESASSRRVPRPRDDLPVEFSLQDGEQRVLLDGLASVAVEFNRMGEADFVTVVINIAGSEPTRHAVLGAGARFEFSINGRAYLLSVMKLTGATAEMRLDRRS